MPHDDHRLAERRSLAYHEAIAERLRQQPERLVKVRQRLEAQCRHPRSPAEGHWSKVWLEALERPLDEVLAFLVERSERADQWRQSTPFAGILTPRERWAIHREVRDQWVREPHETGTA